MAGVVHGFAHAQSLGGFDARRAEDLELLVQAVAPSAQLRRTHQTHSAHVRWICAEDAPLPTAEREAGIDGLATADPNLALVALGADCPMLFLVVPAEPAIAIVHCGWRGVAGRIVDRSVELLLEHVAAPTSTWRAVIAPGARGCCYEVGTEVLEQLDAAEIRIDSIVRPYGGASRSIDLAAGIAQRLSEHGLAPQSIEIAPACTICGGEHFHSHRRSGTSAGRMAGVLALQPCAP